MNANEHALRLGRIESRLEKMAIDIEKLKLTVVVQSIKLGIIAPEAVVGTEFEVFVPKENQPGSMAAGPDGPDHKVRNFRKEE